MKIGQVVKSVAGRDQGRLLVVMADAPNGVFVIDGKERPLERPKLKNQKHLAKTDYCLSQEEYRSNKALRSVLNRLKVKMNSERGHLNV